MRTVAIIQARMGSSRLPGKILEPLAGKPVLQRVIEPIHGEATHHHARVRVAASAKLRSKCLDDRVRRESIVSIDARARGAHRELRGGRAAERARLVRGRDDRLDGARAGRRSVVPVRRAGLRNAATCRRAPRLGGFSKESSARFVARGRVVFLIGRSAAKRLLKAPQEGPRRFARAGRVCRMCSAAERFVLLPSIFMS